MGVETGVRGETSTGVSDQRTLHGAPRRRYLPNTIHSLMKLTVREGRMREPVEYELMKVSEDRGGVRSSDPGTVGGT